MNTYQAEKAREWIWNHLDRKAFRTISEEKLKLRISKKHLLFATTLVALLFVAEIVTVTVTGMSRTIEITVFLYPLLFLCFRFVLPIRLKEKAILLRPAVIRLILHISGIRLSFLRCGKLLMRTFSCLRLRQQYACYWALAITP